MHVAFCDVFQYVNIQVCSLLDFLILKYYTEFCRVGEMGLVGTFSKKNVHNTQESLNSGMSDIPVKRSIDIYFTNSGYKNIHDYFENLP